MVGHSTDKPGAEIGVSADGVWHGSGIHEHEWSRELARRLTGRLEKFPSMVPIIFERALKGSYQARMLDICQRVNRSPAELVISLHFNAMPSGYKGSQSGGEALHYPGSVRGAHAADCLGRACAYGVGNPFRGAKGQARSWAASTVDPVTLQPIPDGPPLYILTHTKAPAVILEPFYGDHSGDTIAATESRDSGRLASCLSVSIVNLLESWSKS